MLLKRRRVRQRAQIMGGDGRMSIVVEKEMGL